MGEYVDVVPKLDVQSLNKNRIQFSCEGCVVTNEIPHDFFFLIGIVDSASFEM